MPRAHGAAGISAADDAPAAGPGLTPKASREGSQADQVSSGSSDLDESDLDLLADDSSSSSSQHSAEEEDILNDGADDQSAEDVEAESASEGGSLTVDTLQDRTSTTQAKSSSQKGIAVGPMSMSRP